MGCVFNVEGTREIILDPVDDLKDLIEKYIGTEARDLYAEIIQNYEDQLKIRQEDLDDEVREADHLKWTIEEARFNVGQVLDDLQEEVDLADVRRRLKNIHWELSY